MNYMSWSQKYLKKTCMESFAKLMKSRRTINHFNFFTMCLIFWKDDASANKMTYLSIATHEQRKKHKLNFLQAKNNQKRNVNKLIKKNPQALATLSWKTFYWKNLFVPSEVVKYGLVIDELSSLQKIEWFVFKLAFS